MKLHFVKENPQIALNYMERLVNDGSPSGFSEKFNTTLATNPFHSDGFNLFQFKNGTMRQYGVLPSCIEKYGVLAHPDWVNNCSFDDIYLTQTDLRAVPTSSSRTVRLENDSYYIKMSYPGIIGRMYRVLEEQHIISALEVSSIFHNLVDNESMPSSFAFLPEDSGCLFVQNNFSTGYVVRNARAVGKNVDRIQYITPAFSLFSTDRGALEDPPLIIQIIRNKKVDQYLLEQIFFPLIDIYMTCSLFEGLNPEMHAQNILFGFNDEDDIVSLILRDMESVDKDSTIRKQLNKSPFSNQYKLISADDYNYKIKHSFMFDHKLGEYLIQELINKVERFLAIDNVKIIDALRNYTRNKYGKYIKYYFPEDGCWYRFDKVQIDRTQKYLPYIKFQNPILR